MKSALLSPKVRRPLNRRLTAVFLVLFLCSVGFGARPTSAQSWGEENDNPLEQATRLVVTFKEESGVGIASLNSPSALVIPLDETLSEQEKQAILERWQNHPNVEAVEPDVMVFAENTLPNDPLMVSLSRSA